MNDVVPSRKVNSAMNTNRLVSAVFAAAWMLVLGCDKNARIEEERIAAEKSISAQREAAAEERGETETAESRFSEESQAAAIALADKEAEKAEAASTSDVGDLSKVNGPTTGPRFPGYVTTYDIMTPEDQFYFHYLNEMCSGGDLAKWPLVKALVSLGHNLVDAKFLASLANETIHISDQPRAAPIVKVVKECADLLQVAAPAVHIKGDSTPNAYVVGMREPHVLVLTSGLLDLFEERPDELRFIIGHEIGHIKAKHLKTHFLASSFVSALVGQRGKEATFKQEFVAALSIGTLLHWYRESEYSADRAGLLCIGGDARVATQALLRLIHKTKPSNKLFDPSHPDFDAQLVLKNQMRLRDEPFVKIISYLRQWQETHPFIPERCAALGMWALTAEYQMIVERPQKMPTTKSLVITEIGRAHV